MIYPTIEYILRPNGWSVTIHSQDNWRADLPVVILQTMMNAYDTLTVKRALGDCEVWCITVQI